jgi:hypothetical protein
MRPRKVKLPLSVDGLLSTLVPGKAYTLRCLALLYEGGERAIECVLQQACDAGAMEASGKNRGYRKRYWVRSDYKPNVAERRWQAADTKGELAGYDLMAHARLCNTFRRQ